MITVLCLFSIMGFSQYKSPIFQAKDKLSIAEIAIEDEFLRDAISKYIDSLPNIDSTFIKYGYLILTIKKKDNKKNCYDLNRYYYYYYSDEKKWQDPLFYTYINNRLVLVNTDINRMANYQLTKKSIKKLVKLINSTLPKIEYHYIKDPNTGQKKKLRPGGGIVLEKGGINFCGT